MTKCIMQIRTMGKQNHEFGCKFFTQVVLSKLGKDIQEVGPPSIFRQSAHEGGKVFSPTHRLPLPTRIHHWYSFVLTLS